MLHSLKGSGDTSEFLYRKILSSTTLLSYELHLPSEPTAFSLLLETLTREDNSFAITFFMLELEGFWRATQDGGIVTQLVIAGQLESKNAKLTLQAKQSTLTLFTDAAHPAFVVVEHETTDARLSPDAHVLSAVRDTRSAQLLYTHGEDLQIGQGLGYLAHLPGGARDGVVLILQSPAGYPEIHRFPSSGAFITLNDIHYQVTDDGELYAVGATDGRITGERLLRYGDATGNLVGIAFPDVLPATRQSLDNGTLSVNHLRLERLSGQALLYFGPIGQRQDVVPLQLLQDTYWLSSLPSSAEQPERSTRKRRHLLNAEKVASSAQRPTFWATRLLKKSSCLLGQWCMKLRHYSSMLLPASGWAVTTQPKARNVEPWSLDQMHEQTAYTAPPNRQGV